jgi:hypothetical protein
MRTRVLMMLCVLAWPIFGYDGAALSIGELARKADLVARGKVVSSAVERDGEGRILTRVKIAVEEVLKGAPKEPLLTVALSGGTLGERRAVTGGQVTYAIGEEVVGFYIWNERGEAVTLSLAQGKFRVRRDGEKAAVSNGGDEKPLEELKRRVREAGK